MSVTVPTLTEYNALAARVAVLETLKLGTRLPADELAIAALQTAVAALQAGAPPALAPAAVSIQWPNEPAGLTPISDFAFDLARDAGWVPWPQQQGGVAVVSDPSAPYSPPNVLQWTYPAGFAGGYSPTNEALPLPAGLRELYVGMYWKCSSPWQPHQSSGVNKICFFKYADGSSQEIAVMRGTGPYSLQIERESVETKWYGTGLPFSLGVWHLLEFHFLPSQGLMEFWCDGQLVGRYTGLAFPNQDWGQVAFDPIWGGVVETKTETDYCWLDHVRVSGR